MSFKEALTSVKKLQHLVLQKKPEIMEKLVDLYSEMEQKWAKSKLKEFYQTVITDFLKVNESSKLFIYNTYNYADVILEQEKL